MKEVSVEVACLVCVCERVCASVWKTWRKYIKNFADAFSASLTKRETLDLAKNSCSRFGRAAVASLLPHWLCPSLGNSVKSSIKLCGKRFQFGNS